MNASTPTENNSSDSHQKNALSKALKHMDSMFAMAQVLTLDHEKAVQLVEKTYLRALTEPAIHQMNIQDRRYLLQLLIDMFKEESTSPASLFAQVDQTDDTPDRQRKGLNSVEVKLLEDTIRRLLPIAFASLSYEDRALLILSEVEQLSCADASLIMSSDSEEVCLRLQQAKAELNDSLIANASPAEAALLNQTSLDDWIQAALQKSLKANYNAVPATMEPRIRSSFSKESDSNQAVPTDSSALRLPRPSSSTSASNSRITQRISGLLLILAAGLIGYATSTMIDFQPDTDLLSLSVKNARSVKPILSTSSPGEAEEFVINHLDWQLSLPAIDDASIQGVGISEITQGVRVPVFLYSDDAGKAPVTLYAYTYSLLDQFGDRIELSSEILTAIADRDHIDRPEPPNGSNVFVWRNANEIFVAVTPLESLDLRIRER